MVLYIENKFNIARIKYEENAKLEVSHPHGGMGPCRPKGVEWESQYQNQNSSFAVHKYHQSKLNNKL